MVRSEPAPQDFAREFKPNALSIAHWVRQAERDGVQRRDGGVLVTEREELSKLRRENDRLRQSRDIVAKAAAWFARERVPSWSSGS
jgi:transposase